MALSDEENVFGAPRKSPALHEIGQPLDLLSRAATKQAASAAFKS
jgi:hypothetical protein